MGGPAMYRIEYCQCQICVGDGRIQSEIAPDYPYNSTHRPKQLDWSTLKPANITTTCSQVLLMTIHVKTIVCTAHTIRRREREQKTLNVEREDPCQKRFAIAWASTVWVARNSCNKPHNAARGEAVQTGESIQDLRTQNVRLRSVINFRNITDLYDIILGCVWRSV